MSYGFNLTFAMCDDVGKAFQMAQKATEKIWNNLKAELEDNTFFIPQIRNVWKEPQLIRAANETWLHRFLTVGFIWWPPYNLLAVAGAYKTPFPDDFTNHIYFQNSCDQDYDFDEWKGLDEPFCTIVHTAKSGSINDVAKLVNAGNSSLLWEYDPSEDDEQYYRRSAAYNAIYHKLDLNSWLYGIESKNFVRFALTPLNSQERRYEAQRILAAVVHAYDPSKML